MSETLHRHARWTIAHGSKSFAAAARLLAPPMRRDVMLLYCWCRHCDDITDGQVLGHGRSRPAGAADIAELRNRSLMALSGRAEHGLAFEALAEVARRHELPAKVVADHLSGFELDVRGWRPDNPGDLLEYCYFVAGAVGIMMARIMGVRDAATLLRASDLGIAFQLTNIARDLADDSAAGRCYVPTEWLAEHGLAASDLADPSAACSAHRIACRLVGIAEPYYASAEIGIRALPPRAAWAIATAQRVYRDIGVRIVRTGPAAIRQRVATGRMRKLWRIATGTRALVARKRCDEPRRGLFTPATVMADG